MDTSDHFAEKIRDFLENAGDCLVVASLDESKLNRHFGEVLEAQHFTCLSNSHVFIYTGNVAGEAMLGRINREPFMQENV